MAQDRIESRRAFMKNLGKVTGIVSFLAPLLASKISEADTTSNEVYPGSNICSYSVCMLTCSGTMKGGCGTCTCCVGTCKETCESNCRSTANKD